LLDGTRSCCPGGDLEHPCFFYRRRDEARTSRRAVQACGSRGRPSRPDLGRLFVCFGAARDCSLSFPVRSALRRGDGWRDQERGEEENRCFFIARTMIESLTKAEARRQKAEGRAARQKAGGSTAARPVCPRACFPSFPSAILPCLPCLLALRALCLLKAESQRELNHPQCCSHDVDLARTTSAEHRAGRRHNGPPETS